VWDALRSARPYKEPWTDERVREHLRQGAGGHFDPEVVSVFLQLDWETEE
jgi:response regulator RpfG family c-di-GMP phosphodiesterase